jgi:deferrochelatase/peroxidase EfeB
MPTETIGTAALPWADIQGLILRGYSHPKARHFVLQFPNAAAGQKLVAALVPIVTTGQPWGLKPRWCINVGFTADGLRTLGLTVSLANNFPQEFIDGAIKRAQTLTGPNNNLGDTGDSAPEHWLLSLGTAGAAHAILSAWAIDDAARDAVTEKVDALLASSGTKSLGSHDADDLPMSFVHFGYRDGISQPNIDGAPMKKHGLDTQPLVATGEFVTGYPNQSGTTMPVPLSAKFGTNGCYSAFRILEQNVAAFFAYVDAHAKQLGIDPGVIQANFCGRETDGTPLATHTGPGLNNFDYSDDPSGTKCPYDAHIRRNHPRNSLGFGPPPPPPKQAGEGYRHRVLRRALPYGPPWDPAHPDHDKRGLIGHFMGASLAQQFEFVTTQWTNGVTVANNHDDALIGANTPSGRLQMANGTILAGFARFTLTRGSAYLFFPSITALGTLTGT